jgi:hypothetical protein
LKTKKYLKRNYYEVAVLDIPDENAHNQKSLEFTTNSISHEHVEKIVLNSEGHQTSFVEVFLFLLF